MTATETCPECGQTLPADAPAGVCPKCLLAVGLTAAEDTLIEVSEHTSSSGSLPNVTKIRYFGDYELLEEIYGDMCCSDADYEDRPYYDIAEFKE